MRARCLGQMRTYHVLDLVISSFQFLDNVKRKPPRSSQEDMSLRHCFSSTMVLIRCKQKSCSRRSRCGCKYGMVIEVPAWSRDRDVAGLVQHQGTEHGGQRLCED